MLSDPQCSGLLAVGVRPRILLVAQALLVVSGFAPRVQAATGAAGESRAPKVSLSWSGADTEDGCLGAAALARGVESYLGRRVFSPPPTDIVVRVRVTSESTRQRALVEVFDARANEVLGERELEARGGSCAALDEPLELAVALMVDGDPISRAAPAAERKLPAPADEASPAEERLAWLIEGHALAQAFLLPKPSAGLELSLSALISERLRARVEVGGFLPAEAEVRAPASADVWLAYAALGPCAGFPIDRRFSLHACAGPVVAYASVNHEGLEGGEGGAVSFFGASLGLHAETRLGGPVYAKASFRSHYFPAPPRFVYRIEASRADLYDFKHFGAVAGLGLAVKF
jgi:hypothetical protein